MGVRGPRGAPARRMAAGQWENIRSLTLRVNANALLETKKRATPQDAPPPFRAVPPPRATEAN